MPQTLCSIGITFLQFVPSFNRDVSHGVFYSAKNTKIMANTFE